VQYVGQCIELFTDDGVCQQPIYRYIWKLKPIEIEVFVLCYMIVRLKMKTI
jgi:hypothetical protein